MRPISVTITSDQLKTWAGRRLTGEETQRLIRAIPHSSIPDAISTIVAGFDDD